MLFLRLTIYVLSFALLFEQQARSIGYSATAAIDPLFVIGTAAKPSHIGVILPIFFMLYFGNFHQKLAKDPIFHGWFVMLLYGLLVFCIRDNTLFSLASDLTVWLGIFAGLSLGMLVPNSKRSIALAMALPSLIATIISTVILYFLPDSQILQASERLTHPAAFVLVGLPLVLLAPSIIICFVVQDSKLMLIPALNAVLLLCAAIVMQTRSLLLAVISAILLASFSIIGIASAFYRAKYSKRIAATITTSAFILSAIVLVALKDAVEAVLDRMQGAVDLALDGGIGARFDEVSIVFQSMSLFDHVLGMGFSPPAILTDLLGTPHTAMHFGLLNIWWRFGFPITLAVVFFFAYAVFRFLTSIKQIHGSKVGEKCIAAIICLPAVIVVFFISCMSGGWGVSTMLPLGMVWAFHRRLTNAY
jgi:hypothetical protein